jgi:hypothetical protein
MLDWDENSCYVIPDYFAKAKKYLQSITTLAIIQTYIALKYCIVKHYQPSLIFVRNSRAPLLRIRVLLKIFYLAIKTHQGPEH